MTEINRVSICTSLLVVLFLSLGGAAYGQASRKSDGGTGAYSGQVTDNGGEPIVGAFVYYKGTSTGVSTDIDGRYSIAAPKASKGAVLIFQYLGMVSQEFSAGPEGGTLNVRLLPDNELDGSVIVGAYGTAQKREDMVGSAFQVNSASLVDKPKTRVENMLQGLVPGLSVSPNADYATTVRSRFNTRVRGDASLAASSEPLWIVDGVQFYTGGRTNQMTGMSSTVGPLSFLDPDDIESITDDDLRFQRFERGHTHNDEIRRKEPPAQRLGENELRRRRGGQIHDVQDDERLPVHGGGERGVA